MLLITPKNINVKYPARYQVETVDDSTPFNEIAEWAKAEERVIVFGYSLYHPKELLDAQERLADWIYEIAMTRSHLRKDWVLLVREAAGFAYSRLKSLHGSSKLKAALLTLGREARSAARLTFLFDTQKELDCDVQLRREFDKILVKRQFDEHLSDDLEWLPKAIKKRQALYGKGSMRVFTDLPYLKTNECYLVLPGRKRFQKFWLDLPPFHHRVPTDELEQFGVEIYGASDEPIDEQKALDVMAERWCPLPNLRRMPKATKQRLIEDIKSLHETDYAIAKKLAIPRMTIWRWQHS